MGEMNIVYFLDLFSSNLIPVMGALLVLAIVLKWIAYQTGTKELYFVSSFYKELNKKLDIHKLSELKNSKEIESAVIGILDDVGDALPDRGIRGRSRVKSASDEDFSIRSPKKQSLIDFASGKRTMINSLKSQVDVFKSTQPPHFPDVTYQMLGNEKSWNYLLGFIPFKATSRLIDILPGLFIVGGIFGTFLGITAALPIIAEIDLNNMNVAGSLLSKFVAKVAFSMHTSIFGIIFSVTLTLLNTLFPIKVVRNDIYQHLLNSVERLWYRIHGSKIDPYQEKVLKILERIEGQAEIVGGHFQKSSKSKSAKTYTSDKEAA